jgi:hypothetical protein
MVIVSVGTDERNGEWTMPIVRWHGWAAKCGACGKFVDIGDGMIAFEQRDHVRDAVIPPEDRILWRTQEEAIRSLCGCRRVKR